MARLAPANPEIATSLHQVAVALLTPAMKLAGADPALARAAARGAIAGYVQAGASDLIGIAAGISLLLTATDTLRLSADPDMAPEQKLRMRDSAAAQARTARRFTAVPPVAAAPHQVAEPPAPDAVAAETPADAAERQQALAKLHAVQAEIAEPAAAERARERSQARAHAMVRVAADCARNLDAVPMPRRRLELVRVTALTDAATHMMRSQDRRRAASETASRTEATAPTITVARA